MELSQSNSTSALTYTASKAEDDHEIEEENQVNAENTSERSEETNKQQSKTDFAELTDVKSSAIVKCTAVEPPSCFLQLSSNTDLKQPPANWLRSNTKWQGRFGQWTFSKKNAIFASFNMANMFTDCVGEVDVISDAENIKKLLMIPYSGAHISMMVHRVGKTVLIDGFDINSHVIRTQKKWEWVRQFYSTHVLEKEKAMFRKNKTRAKLQNMNMFSKFLYYSLPDAQTKHDVQEHSDSQSSTDTQIQSETSDSQSSTDTQIQSETHESSTPVELFSWNTPTIPDPIEEDTQGLEDNHEFLRNVLWTFEDIRMLVGSDMPIFGGGTRPAVSLRLREMHKPINVLTGLDYWLDNLMCNVPEVIMCYHLDGIVQKYEVIKTEDIPHLENSKFSPKLVKDIAQNILSFLKSNATKSGHTYWLFKGKDDDVVKLYDLTTLCADMMDEKEQNPFAFPVAMLLYRVARNMKDSPDSHRKQGTIHKLLKNCILLLDPQKHPQIVTSAHYLLADLFVPNDMDRSFDDASFPENENEEGETEDELQNSDLDKFEVDENGHVTSPSVEVKALCFPTTYKEESFSDIEKLPQVINKNFDEKCHEAIEHILQGLKCIVASEDAKPFCKPGPSEIFKQPEEEAKMAKPYEAIPLHYASLKKESVSEKPEKVERSKGEATENSDVKVKHSNDGTCICNSTSHVVPSGHNPSWKECCKILLLLKATQVYGALSEAANSMNKFGQALKYVKLGIMCYNSAQAIISSHGTKCHTEPLADLLGLAGDIHLMIVQGDQSVNREYHKEQYEFLSSTDQAIMDIINEASCDNEVQQFHWAYEWTSTLEASLTASYRCYHMASKMLPEGKKESQVRLMRRIGNVCNELGVFYMSQATRIWNEEQGQAKQKVDMLWKKTHSYLEKGIAAFEEVNDADNIALLHSNIGRLMRICAHAHGAPPSNGASREFSSQERHYYDKAVQSYQKALHVLGQRSCSPEIWDTVTWELSTTFYNMGCLLQDFAPLSTMAQEKVEKEITEVMFKALKLCESDTSPSRQLIYLYRMASIHHRLGSLYHHACRNHVCSGEKQKQLRTLADRHYSKACDIFDSLENNTEFFRVLLERIGMWEHQLSGFSGFSSKLKTLRTLLELTISSLPMIERIVACNSNDASVTKAVDVQKSVTSQDDEDEELYEQKKLLKLLKDRLQHTIENLVKVYATKSSKFEAALKKWKEMYSKVSRVVDDGCFEQNLISLLCEIKELISEKQAKERYLLS